MYVGRGTACKHFYFYFSISLICKNKQPSYMYYEYRLGGGLPVKFLVFSLFNMQ